MGILITKIQGEYNSPNMYEFNCLSLEDMSNLPTSAKTGLDKNGNVLKKCAIGSLAYVSGTQATPIGKVFKLNSLNEWVENPESEVNIVDEEARELISTLQTDLDTAETTISSQGTRLTTAESNISGKASKTQESWITPTFLDGTTGDVKYRKNQFGRVEFTGSAITTGLDKSLFTLNTGYRPALDLYVNLVSTDKEVVVGIVKIDGTIMIYGTAGKTYIFNTLSFVV